MKLVDAILNIQYDADWGIWAETPFTPDSQARYGQRQFKNGGLLDDKVFFADGIQCGEFLALWCDGNDDLALEAAEEMILEWLAAQ